MKKGFTLIELLVAISIVAILSVVGLISFRVILQNTRDSKRLSDLSLIQSALQQYNNDQFYYPDEYTGPSCDSENGTFKFNLNPVCSLKSKDGTKTYLNQIPVDPLGTTQYCYKALQSGFECDTQATSNCTNGLTDKCVKYCLYAKGEKTEGGPYSCRGGTDYNIKVTPP